VTERYSSDMSTLGAGGRTDLDFMETASFAAVGEAAVKWDQASRLR
jgi:hypothetical protein